MYATPSKTLLRFQDISSRRENLLPKHYCRFRSMETFWRTYKTRFKIRQMKDKVRCSKFECQKAFWDSARTVCKKHNFKASGWELNLRGRRSRGFNSRRPWSCIFCKQSRLRLKMYIFLTLRFITPYCVTFIYWQRV